MTAGVTVWASIAVAVLALLGGVYSIGTKASTIDAKLDRNCRSLASIQADTRYLIIQQSRAPSSQDFRQIFRHSAIEACG